LNWQVRAYALLKATVVHYTLEMIKILSFTITIAFFVTNPSFASEKGELLIKEIQETYQYSDDFSCTGSMVTRHFVDDFEMSKYTTNFTIKLKKPNHFQIHWQTAVEKDNPLNSEGAIWSDNGKYYYYQDIYNGYFIFSNFERVFSVATGVSYGIANQIPSLFFPALSSSNWLSAIKNPTLTEQKDKHIKLIGLDIGQESIQKFVIEISSKERFIEKYSYNYSKTDSNKIKAENLRKTIIDFEKNRKKYEKLFSVNSEYKDPSNFDSMLQLLNKKIEHYSKLPENLHTSHVEDKVNFKSISTAPLRSVDFMFNVPQGVIFKGNNLEQAIEIIN